MGPSAPKLRADLFVGPHPDDPDRTLVAVDDEAYELPPALGRVAKLLDGRPWADVVEAAARGGLSASACARARDALARVGLLDPQAAAPPGAAAPRPQWRRAPLPAAVTLRVHPEARFACHGSGLCCEAGYAIPVPAATAPRLRAEGRARGADDPLALRPVTIGGTTAWSYVLDNADGCPFLTRARRCALHGRPEQPPACDVFPLRFARHGGELRATVAPRCVCGVGEAGPPLAEQSARIRAAAARAPGVPAVPDRVQWDVARDDPAEVVLDRLTAAADASSSAAQLQAALPPLAHRAAAPRFDSLVAALADVDDECVQHALRGAPHPRAADVADAVRAAGARGDASEELRRVVRDALFGWSVLQAPTVAEGVARWAVVAKTLPAAASLAAARGHLMLWAEAWVEPAVATAFHRWFVAAGGSVEVARALATEWGR